MPELNILGGLMPEAPPAVKPAKGQRELFADPVATKSLRRCYRCGDLDQARQPVVYDAADSPGGCPVCGYQEFTVITSDFGIRWVESMPRPQRPGQQENEKMVTKTPTKPKPAARAVAGPGLSPDVRQAAKSAVVKDPAAKSIAVGKLAPGTLSPAEGATEQLGELLHIELDQIQPSPDNPRKDFETEAFGKLVDSIQSIGVLQPILVGRCGGIFELICGERRWRASQSAGRETIPCYVRDMTPEEVTAARLAENLTRDDLTEIDEARGYVAAIERHGWSQAELAKRVGVTPGQISNRIRLLKLPEAWLKRIASREMAATQARDLAPWADLPKLLQHLEKELGSDKPAELTATEWDELIEQAIGENSEPLRGQFRTEHGWWPYDLTKVDEATMRALDVREYRDHYSGKVKAAFNLEVWKKLATEQAAAAKAKADKKTTKAVDGKKPAKGTGKNQPPPGPTAEQIKQREEQHAKRLYRHKISWLQTQIATRMAHLSEDDVLVLVLGMAMIGSSQGCRRKDNFRDAIKKAGLSPMASGEEYKESLYWPWLMGLDRVKLRRALTIFFEHWCTLEAKSYSTDANPAAIECVANTLGVNLAADWRPTESFLLLHTIEQLGTLEHEWKLAPCTSSAKKDIIAHILKHAKNLKAPKSLLNVKAVTLD